MSSRGNEATSFQIPGNEVVFKEGSNLKEAIRTSQAWFKRRATHTPSLTDELGTAGERRLNQLGSANNVKCGGGCRTYPTLERESIMS